MVRDSPISHWQWSPFFLVVVSWTRGKTNKVDSLDSLFYAFYSINSVITVHLQKLTVKQSVELSQIYLTYRLFIVGLQVW